MAIQTAGLVNEERGRRRIRVYDLIGASCVLWLRMRMEHVVRRMVVMMILMLMLMLLADRRNTKGLLMSVAGRSGQRLERRLCGRMAARGRDKGGRIRAGSCVVAAVAEVMADVGMLRTDGGGGIIERVSFRVCLSDRSLAEQILTSRSARRWEWP